MKKMRQAIIHLNLLSILMMMIMKQKQYLEEQIKKENLL